MELREMHTETLSYTVDAKPSTFEYYTERYYHQYLVKNCKGVENNNCRLLVHSNGLCILCIDESHAAVRSCREKKVTAEENDSGVNLHIASVTFGSGRGNSKMTPEGVRVVGKRKKNAIICQEDTKVCVVTMSDGTVYNIPACIDGFVLELNAAVQERPSLLVEAPVTEGYIAIISPNHSKVNYSKYIKISTATGGDIMDEDEEDLVRNGTD
ncbi:uncharacterized protein TM35_000015980 [Trypanosoma theileri]|uniref:Protein Abitram n=1 Tax=Trypanosoma theileri TaxID=67003 RepID=A0A1X0PA68_9TRYP|nr:uncharacterized protein TM35_000015980 [Trypanosoma theileri]ORC93721.1 hypothetical protein TM35_000015980 [Trypanosoma theileri]